MRLLLFIFIATPLLEMLVLFEAADLLGAWITLFLVILTAVIGLNILKKEGISTLLRANARLTSGELPAQEIIETMLLAGAGALLITPGFLTDFLGFSLLTRHLRQLVARSIMRAGFLKTLIVGNAQAAPYRTSDGQDFKFRSGGIYEAEYTKEREKEMGKIEDFEGKNTSKKQ